MKFSETKKKLELHRGMDLKRCFNFKVFQRGDSMPRGSLINHASYRSKERKNE